MKFIVGGGTDKNQGIDFYNIVLYDVDCKFFKMDF